ncbi:MAG: hypothetical protein JWQ53_2425 [Klenkia sp.]|nr:hypothetical protein [Klenkia sp.]
MLADRSVIARARQVFLDAGLDAPPVPGVRPVILASWRRSLLHGLSPADALPRDTPGADRHGQLARAATPVLDRRRTTLADLRAGITLTDQEGRVLGRWVEDRGFARRLDARHVVAGTSIAELTIGTTSGGVAVETGAATMVVGHEHFSDGAVSMTTAGAAVRHPVTRRLLGSLNLLCGVEDTHDLLLPWIREMAAEVERSLLDAATRRDRLLLDAYVTSTRDARHPVVCLDDQTVITNAAAARLLDAGDQAMVWEVASHRIAGGRCEPGHLLTLTSGQVVRVEAAVVEDGTRAFGAVLTLAPVTTASSAARTPTAGTPAASASVDPLAGLAGRGTTWTAWCRRVREAAADPSAALLLTGEPGTGKTTVARALLGGDGDAPREMDAAELGDDWVTELATALQRRPAGLLLRRLDLLGPAAATATTRLVARSSGTRVVATATQDTDGALGALLDWPGPVRTAPALRERRDDLPDLLRALSQQLTGRSPRWTSEVVQTLHRQPWPANLHSLSAVVRVTLEGHTSPDVTLHHLPSEVSARGSRRALSGLEQVEARALTAALAAAGGNKREAADALGIARSTLYRKVRALGLDLSAATF